MDTYIFFTKGRGPKRIKAVDHIKACEQFYAENPDFHLRELIHIEHKPNKLNKHNEWLDSSMPHSRTEDSE